MEALISRADAILPLTKKRKSSSSASGTHGVVKSRPAKVSSRSPKSQARSRHSKGKDRNVSETVSIPDATLSSVARRTTIPPSLLPPPDPSTQVKRKQEQEKDAFPHISDKKLKARLSSHRSLAATRSMQVTDAALLLPTSAGLIEATDPLDRTWKVTQGDLLQNEGVGREAAAGRRELVLDGGAGGGFKTRWTRNGRHTVMVGRRGRLASVDWMTGSVHAEIQLKETCRDVTYLHSHHHVAVAQSRHAFIYDQNLVELHRLSALIEPAFLEFLPYHWLLVCAGLPGTLSYLDTSMGTIVAQHRPKLGPPTALSQNTHNAVVYWGAGNGTVTLWTPSSTTPHVRLLAHLGPITALSVDPSSGGRYLATGGMDGRVKVWDSRNYASPVREWSPRSGPASALEWSQRGVLAVASGGTVNTYTSPTIQSPHSIPALPPLYLTHPLPSGSKPTSSLRFEPFQDVLAIGHGKGISTILVPGAGEPNFDSAEADPFENTKRRAEREVRGLLDKIQPDMITLDPDFVGSLAPPSKLAYTNTTAGSDENGRRKVPISSGMPFRNLPRLERLRVQGKADETEVMEESEEEYSNEMMGAKTDKRVEKEKMKMRGKGKALKRYLKKKRKNVIEPSTIAIREKLEKHREERKQAREQEKRQVEGLEGALPTRPSALDRFRGK
ncbi:NUC141 domain-containing protein [Gautieria morchelliformis]|nr:NUC141 domain-containing protein [Gautieria morchelliformis]